MELDPIGVIHTPFTEPLGTPIQPAAAKGARGTVEVLEKYAEGLKDLDGFERVWLVYWFDRAAETRLLVRPYLVEEAHGLFATRAPCRPNPIGISSVKLVSVEGNVLHVEDVDMLDGTPLLDIKPYVSHFDVFDVERNGWLDEALRRRKLTEAEADGRFHGG